MIARGIVMGLWLAAVLLCAANAAGDAQPATLQQLQDFYPKINDKANAALIYQKAQDARVMGEFCQEAPIIGGGKALTIPARPLDPKVKDAFAKELEENAETLRLLHQAGSISQCRFPIDLTKGQTVELAHLARMRDFARLLEVQAIVAAEDKRPELAAQSVLDIMALARSLRKEPVLISQLVRIACWGIAYDALEQVVNRVPFEDSVLQQFQNTLALADDREALTRAFQGELCVWMGMETETPEERAAREQARAEYEEQMMARQEEEASRAEAAEETPAADSDGKEASASPAEGAGEPQAAGPEEAGSVPPGHEALYQPKLDPRQKLEMIQELRRRVDESRLPYVDFIKLVPWYDPKTMTPDRYNQQQQVKGQRLPALRRAMVSAARNAAKAAAAQSAMAVERYRLKNGKLPENWDDMIPDFLSAPIQDPFATDPILFRTTDNGYVLYSIGHNGKDDGGAEGDSRPPLDHTFRFEKPASAGPQGAGNE